MESIKSTFQGLSETVARFVDEEPLLASLAAVVVVALILWVVAKLAKAAAVFVLVMALVAGLLVYTLGPDRARGYLDQIREGPSAAENQ